MVNSNSLSCGVFVRRTFYAACVLRNVFITILLDTKGSWSRRKIFWLLERIRNSRGLDGSVGIFPSVGYLESGTTLSCLFPLMCLWPRTLQKGERAWFASKPDWNVVTPTSFQINLSAARGGQSHRAGWEGANLLFCTDVSFGLCSQVGKLLAGNTGWGFLNRTDPLGSFLQKNMKSSKRWLEKKQFPFHKMWALALCFILNSQKPLSKTLHQRPSVGVSLLPSLLQGC